MAYKQQVSASSTHLGPEDALFLAHEASKVIVAKGKKVVTFDMKKSPPDNATLLAALLGPTGRLRAPAIRHGSTLLVGFEEEVYKKVFG